MNRYEIGIDEYKQLIFDGLNHRLTLHGRGILNCYPETIEKGEWLQKEIMNHYKPAGWQIYFIYHMNELDFQISISTKTVLG